jgi:heterotetrameric sarcosine oxidase delta subunit
MRIPCPYCGPRDAAEFSYRGDASLSRPDPSGDRAIDDAAMFAYVYLRDNPAGPHREYWYHGHGCRSWLVVTRDTTSHDISEVRLATAERRS